MVWIKVEFGTEAHWSSGGAYAILILSERRNFGFPVRFLSTRSAGYQQNLDHPRGASKSLQSLLVKWLLKVFFLLAHFKGNYSTEEWVKNEKHKETTLNRKQSTLIPFAMVTHLFTVPCCRLMFLIFLFCRPDHNSGCFVPWDSLVQAALLLCFACLCLWFRNNAVEKVANIATSSRLGRDSRSWARTSSRVESLPEDSTSSPFGWPRNGSLNVPFFLLGCGLCFCREGHPVAFGFVEGSAWWALTPALSLFSCPMFGNTASFLNISVDFLLRPTFLGTAEEMKLIPVQLFFTLDTVLLPSTSFRVLVPRNATAAFSLSLLALTFFLNPRVFGVSLSLVFPPEPVKCSVDFSDFFIRRNGVKFSCFNLSILSIIIGKGIFEDDAATLIEAFSAPQHVPFREEEKSFSWLIVIQVPNLSWLLGFCAKN